MRFIHLADVHFDAANQEAALKSLTTVAETAEREKPAFVIIAGDLFNRSVALHQSRPLLRVLRRIRDVCPILAVSGTVTHDIPGCYAPLMEAGLIELLQPDDPVSSTKGMGPLKEDQCLILGMPEPTKEWLLAGKNGMSADGSNEAAKQALRGILLGLGAFRAQHPDLPCVFVYHGNVTGATMANGQLVEGGISIGREDLALVGADAYLLGHIHLAQRLGDLPAWYPGSAYPVNWGETDIKGFNLIEIEAGGAE